jgi:hypothetical protein
MYLLACQVISCLPCVHPTIRFTTAAHCGSLGTQLNKERRVRSVGRVLSKLRIFDDQFKRKIQGSGARRFPGTSDVNLDAIHIS